MPPNFIQGLTAKNKCNNKKSSTNKVLHFLNFYLLQICVHYLTEFTKALKASGLFIAKSASTFLSNPIPLACSLLIN